MTAPTHSVFGMLLSAVAFSLFSYPLFRDPVGIGFVLLGALLPDIDHRASSIGRVLFFISLPLERRWGHRTVTHSLLALLALALASFPLLFFSRVWWSCLSIGYLSHLLIDASNKSGTPFFWPSKSVCVFPYADRLRISTGSMKGEGPLLIILIVLLGLYMPVANLGLFRAIRYLTASQRSAYTEYRSAATATVLEFKGIYADSRETVRGAAPILEGDFYKFVIYFQDRPVEYGETGEIIPLKSRVKILDRPLRIRKLTLNNQPLSAVLQGADSCLVSGKLRSGADFVCESASPLVRFQGRDLIIDYARPQVIESVLISRGKDEALLSRLKMDMDILEVEIESFKSSLPENRLKKLESELSLIESRRASLLACLSSESDPLARMSIREELSDLDRDASRLRSQISSLDMSDRSASLKLKKSMLELDRLKLDYENASSEGVTFSGELSFREL